MGPLKDRKKTASGTHGADFYTKELGRSLQRKLLQRRFDEINEGAISAASHGDEPSREYHGALPREDRAG